MLQRWIGRVIFRRQNLDTRIRRITQLPAQNQTEDELLLSAARELATHLRTDLFAVVADLGAAKQLDQPAILFGGLLNPHLPAKLLWAEALIPLRFSSGEVRLSRSAVHAVDANVT